MTSQTEEEIKEELEEALGSGEEEKKVKPTPSKAVPGASASTNVRMWVDEYAVDFTMNGKTDREVFERALKVIDAAKERGWEPSWKNDTVVSSQTSPQTAPSQPGDVPTCPTHNRPMRSFDGRYGQYYKCTAKLDDGTWCNEKGKK